MVEDTLKKNTLENSKQKSKQETEGTISIAELKKKLPRKVNHITLMMILDYLEKSRKIETKLRGISWRFDSE